MNKDIKQDDKTKRPATGNPGVKKDDKMREQDHKQPGSSTVHKDKK